MFFCLDFACGFGRDFEGFGVPDGRKIEQKSLQNQLKNAIGFCTHLGADFIAFLSFSARLGKRKTSKRDWRDVIFLFGICGSRSIPTCFWIIFWEDLGSKVDPKA